MESFIYILVGYIAWCCLAFLVARYMKIEGDNRKAVSFLLVVLAAPMVIIDVITGKGTLR